MSRYAEAVLLLQVEWEPLTTLGSHQKGGEGGLNFCVRSTPLREYQGETKCIATTSNSDSLFITHSTVEDWRKSMNRPEGRN